MIEHKLSNVLLKPAEHLAGHDELYVFCASPLDYDEETAALRLAEPADFMAFLNACSASKWAKYCDVTTVTLRLELSGDACEVIIKGMPEGAEADSENTVELDRITGAYYAEVDEGRIHPVRIALSTTTFKKEHYIVPNIELIRDAIRSDDGPIHDAFHMFVVDNGSTLDAEALSDDLVTVIPNANVGGAGGFARGMIAAMDSPSEFTHVILMDDDVHVFPESIKRTYNLLALANEKYAHAFVNGAMLSVEQPERLFEDVSHVLRSGVYRKVKPDLFVDRLDQVVENERIDVEVENTYGAWWFSCIPVANIREKGLPVPVFVRCDDVEYGLRSNPTYMTMNGICVWHESFEGRPRASVDCYQYVRNFLVMAACDGHVNTELFMARVWRNVLLRRRDLEYGAADLLLQGVEDYLRGPQWLMEADGSALMRENAKLNDKFVPLAEIDPKILSEGNIREVTPQKHHGLTLADKLLKTIPYDKHLLPDALLKKAPGHLMVSGPALYSRDTLARETIVVLDITGEKACVRRMDRARNAQIKQRVRELKQRWQLEHERVAADYRAAFPTMISQEFWRHYLGMEE